MSIYAYTGLPGSGKSYTVTEHQIIPALKAGRKVVTNVALHAELLRGDFSGGDLVELPTEAVASAPDSIYEYVTPGCVLILDEVWRLFPAGLKANQVPEAFRKLLAEHRHMVDAEGNSCQIVLVTQDLAQISAFARQLVEQTFRTVKLSSVGLSKQYRLDVFNGPVSGPNPPLQNRLREIYGRYHSGVWKYYRSHTMRVEGTEGSGANESPIDKRANMLRSPALILGAVLCLAGALWAIPKLKSTFSTDAGLLGAKKAAAVSADAAPEAQGPQPPQRVMAAAILPTVSTPTATAAFAYRLAAVVVNLEDAARSRALITDGSRTFVIPYDKQCYATPDGRHFCQYRGQEVGEFGIIGSPN